MAVAGPKSIARTVEPCHAPGPAGLRCDLPRHLWGRHSADYGGQRVSWRTDTDSRTEWEL